MGNKQKVRSETQHIKNRINPQGEISNEDIKLHLERKILDEVKKMAQGFTVSVYATLELAKELIAVEDLIEKENSDT